MLPHGSCAGSSALRFAPGTKPAGGTPCRGPHPLHFIGYVFSGMEMFSFGVEFRLHDRHLPDLLKGEVVVDAQSHLTAIVHSLHEVLKS